MGAYRKLIAAVLGVGSLLLVQHTGIDLTEQVVLLEEVIIGTLTALGVWAVPNDARNA